MSRSKRGYTLGGGVSGAKVNELGAAKASLATRPCDPRSSCVAANVGTAGEAQVAAVQQQGGGAGAVSAGCVGVPDWWW